MSEKYTEEIEGRVVAFMEVNKHAIGSFLKEGPKTFNEIAAELKITYYLLITILKHMLKTQKIEFKNGKFHFYSFEVDANFLERAPRMRAISYRENPLMQEIDFSKLNQGELMALLDKHRYVIDSFYAHIVSLLTYAIDFKDAKVLSAALGGFMDRITVDIVITTMHYVLYKKGARLRSVYKFSFTQEEVLIEVAASLRVIQFFEEGHQTKLAEHYEMLKREE